MLDNTHRGRIPPNDSSPPPPRVLRRCLRLNLNCREQIRQRRGRRTKGALDFAREALNSDGSLRAALVPKDTLLVKSAIVTFYDTFISMNAERTLDDGRAADIM